MGRTDGCEDTKTEDSTCVRMGLSLAWKASLATNYEDSFLCNQPCVTLDPSHVYINWRARSVDRANPHNHSQTRLLGFSHYDLVVDQLL